MITAGIDVGAQTTKVVILKDGKEPKIMSHSIVMTGLEQSQAIEQAMEEAVKKAGISRSDIQKVIATGTGRKEVPFANGEATEVACAAKGATFIFPTARTVIDVGAEEGKSVKCDATGRVLDFAKNEKCAAGAGAFVESMARALEVSLDEMTKICLHSQKEIPINVTCVVFAESEVVSLIHSKISKADISRAIHDAIATRTTSMTRKVGVEKDVALIGGIAKNVGFIDCLKRHLALTDLKIPEEPQIVGALGAALLAAR